MENNNENLINSEEVFHDVPGGNTETPGKPKREPPCYRWCFTLKADYTDNTDDSKVVVPIVPKTLYDILSNFCKVFYFQLELSRGGYKHYQGCFSLVAKHRLSEVKNIIGFESVHLERVKNWQASIRYCQKEATRIGIPYNHNSSFIKTIQTLRPWQEFALSLLSIEPDDRKVFWLYDTVGNMGKTAFCKYMAAKKGAIILGNGSFSNLAFALGDNPTVVLFNLTRSIEGVVNYAAIESIKDGLMFSGKYESKMKLFNSPHVMIFANFRPNLSALSEDRWILVDLNNHPSLNRDIDISNSKK